MCNLSYETVFQKYPVIDEDILKNPKFDLYIYLDHHENDGKIDDCWCVKFGETNEKNTVYDRYANITGHSAHRKIFQVWDSTLSDKEIHEILRLKFNWCGEKDDLKNPFNTDEAYFIENIEDIEKILSEIQFHVSTNGKYLKNNIKKILDEKNHKDIFIPRPEQIAFEDKFRSYLQLTKDSKKFLLYAVCRFGKTATTLHSLISDLKMKKILVLSSKCDTAEAWETDFNKWTFSKGYNFLDKKAIQINSSLLNEDKIVCWCSFQSTAKKFETFDEEGNEIISDFEEEPWQKMVVDTNWDIIVTDECHFGVDTKRSSKLIDSIIENNKECVLLEISATPFDKISRGDYTFYNSFKYTLTDEFNDHHNDSDYVAVELYHLDLMKYIEKNVIDKKHGPNLKQEMKEKLNKCFDGNKFSFNSYFQHFDNGELGYEFDLLYNKHFSKTGKHCLIYVNRVNNGTKLARSINNEKYTILNLCGNNKITLDQINAELDKDKPVIIISCGKFMTGVTIKKLTNVIFMGTVNSAAMYIQYGLRAKNKYEGRSEACNVYDLNTQSYIKSDAFKFLICTEAKLQKKKPTNIAKNYEDSIALFEWQLGDIFSPYNNFALDFENNFAHISGDEDIPYFNFDNDILLELRNILNAEKIKNVKMKITEEQCEKANSFNDDTNPKDPKESKKSKQLEKEKKKEIRNIVFKFRKICGFIPTFLKHHNYKSIEEMFNGDIDLFKIWCNESREILKKLKEISNELDWEMFSDNIKVIANNLSSDEEQWKYKGLLPAWF